MSNEFVSIIIVNWYGERFIPKLFDSLRNQTYSNYEVIFLDNNSKDKSINLVKDIKRSFANHINIIQMSENTGYAKGNNIAIKKAKGSYILLLNNDVYLAKDCLEKLISASTKADMVAPKLLYPSGKIQKSISGVPRLRDVFYSSIGLSYISPRFDKWLLSNFEYNKRQIINAQPMFSALLINKNVCNKVGDMDEKLPIFWNDVDWFLRYSRLGFICFYAPEAVAYHHHGASVNKKGRITKIIDSTMSMFYFFSKNYKLTIMQKSLLLVICIYTPIFRLLREIIVVFMNSGNKKTHAKL